MESNGKVSIIVPVYKSEAFLDKCVSSILNQTYQDVELILVDDGSPDNSGKMCDDYAAKDNRVVVIHKANGGTCEARNEGLKKVTGQYLMFADGDDWLAEDCIEYLMSIMQKTGSDMAMTDCVFTTRNLKQNNADF
jgi:glycosyltransferase involved in cell wall biosynthesis